MDTRQGPEQLQIEILGADCPECDQLERVVLDVLDALSLEAGVSRVTNVDDILGYRVPTTPALVIDGRVVAYGRLPDRAEITRLVAGALPEGGGNVVS